MHLSRRAREIPASFTLELERKVQELLAKGIDVISLGAGQPDFPMPAEALAELQAFLQRCGGRVGYTASQGIVELRTAAAEQLSRTTGVLYGSDQVVVTCGAKEALSVAVSAVAERGDEVIVPLPAWLSYEPMVRIADARMVAVTADERTGFKLAPEMLRAALTPATRALMLNSPNNPTGAVYTRDELLALSQVLAGTDVVVISDEIYSSFVYGGEHVSIASLPGMAERTVVVNGVSKAYAMTGWRIGFLAAPRPLADAAANIKSQLTANAATSSQWAALGALRSGEAFPARMREAFARRRALALAALERVPGVSVVPPAGAFYVFPRVDALYGGRIQGSLDLCAAILDEARVACVPGGAFGDDRCIRLSIATADDKLAEGLKRLAAFLGELHASGARGGPRAAASARN